MLRKLLFTLAFLFLFAAPASAGFEEGKAAYDRKDWVTAITELRPIAEQGDDRAMILLGNMYNEGMGVIENQQEAMSLYKRAATEKNNADAMIAVAAMYTSGIGVAPNFDTATQWYCRAALSGSQMGAFFYALALFRGNKTPAEEIKPDFYNSYKWFKIASMQKENAKFQRTALEFSKRLANQMLKPDDVAKADKEAANWKPVRFQDLGPAPADPAEQ